MTNAQVEVNVLDGFDLEQLDSAAGVTHRCAVITNEDGDAVSGFIMVGKNSSEYVASQKKSRVDNIMRSGVGKKAVDTATELGAMVVANTVERVERTTALAVIVGWFGFKRGGVEATFDKAVVAAMLDKCPQWQTKVLGDLESEGNFTPASSKA